VIRSAKLDRSLSCKERRSVSEREEKQEMMSDIFAGSNEFDSQYIRDIYVYMHLKSNDDVISGFGNGDRSSSSELA
jgi:hypothetical protein